MTNPSRSTPLHQRIQAILLERSGTPITVHELRSLLRRQGNTPPEDRLRALLADRRVFTELAGGRYLLRDDLDALPSDTPEQIPDTPLFVRNFSSASNSYIVLDIETSGLDAEVDQIVQISVLRVKDGRPAQFHEWFVQCDPAKLTPALRRKLHIDEATIAQIAAAPPLSEVLPEIRATLGQQTLVIHNARFDMRFLLHAIPDLPNLVVDTMELALLLVPHAPNHKLVSLAEVLEITLEEIVCDTIEGVPAGHVVSEATLHDATTDVLLLDAVYRIMLQRWQALPKPYANLFSVLLSESSEVHQATFELAPFLDTPSAPALLTMPPTDDDALTLLDRVLTARGTTARPSQRTMVMLIADALTTDTSRLIEAPTGTGKTLGYLVPAIWAAQNQGRRIAVATAVKNLQDQVREEIAQLQSVVPVRAQVLKGASSYLCLRNLQQALDDVASADVERRFLLAFLVGWAATSSEIPTLDELPFWLRSTFPATEQLVPEMAVDRLDCTERRCPFYDQCHLFSAYRRAEQADIVLLNHSLWLSEPQHMPPFDALMLDEAHNLEDRATAAYQQEVSEGGLRALLYRLGSPGTRRGALQRVLDLQPDEALRQHVHQARRATGQALTLIAEFRATLATFVVGCDERLRPEHGAQLRLVGRPDRAFPTRWKHVQDAIEQLWDTYIVEICSRLSQITAMLPEAQIVLIRQLNAVRENLQEQQQLLHTILEARRSDLVSWLTVETVGNRTGWAFCAAPISVAPHLAEAYRKLRTVILTSATLTTGPRDFHFFLERLGLRQALRPGDIHALNGALPYHQNALFAIPSYLSYTPAQATIQSFVEELAAELTLLCTYTDGRTLALFTARSRMEAVWGLSHAALEAQGLTVLAQHSGESKQRMIEQFRNGDGVLYGLRSFWEGIDVPGEALSFVVMEKLPYPAQNDPVQVARREAIARQSGREFQDYLFPLMVIQFKQGFGRLLRHEHDRGAVLLYDRRVARKSYTGDLLAALPGYQPRDTVAERSRKGFYRLLAERLPGLIDLESKADMLDALPDLLPTDAEALVARLALPETISEDEYEIYQPRILQAIKELYGHDGFRSPEQEAALRAMLTGRDLIAVLPTGAGKSLCFQLPALLRPGMTVICSPLIALMRDQIDKLQERGVEIAAALMSGQSAADREETLSRARAGRLKLLYLAPERLRDPVVLAALAASPVRQIVVDEAHCVALWGPSFRPDFLVLPQVYGRLKARPPVAAFTATATTAITATIEQALELATPTLVRAPIDRPELRLVVFDAAHRYHPVRSKTDQIRQLLALVQTADRRDEAMLIYVATTARAEELARLLQIAGYTARAYHGKMPVQERANIGDLFMEGLVPIVVCTKAFGMGIDKPDIRYVVHFNAPGDIESYAQEVGRAGRDGQPAYAVLLYHRSDERIHRYFIDQSRPDTELLADLWRWICTQPQRFTLDPLAACERFDIGDLDLRRALYLLEQAKLLTRGADLTIRASLTLLDTWDNVLWLARDTDITLLEQLRGVMPELGSERQDVYLNELATQIGVDSVQVEATLIEFAVAGGCLYRPWEKGYDIQRHAPAETALPTIGMEAVAAQEQKLEQMRGLVLGAGCRWQTLRHYFGQDAGKPCGHCDRCDPEQRYPWSGITARDVPDVSDVLSLGTTLLELIDWNERRVRDGASPFGTTTLLRILRGDQFVLMRHVQPGPAATARLATLRACPYWGVCRTLRRSEAELQTALHRLITEQYTEHMDVERADGGTYTTLRLLERGRTSLLHAERLNW